MAEIQSAASSNLPNKHEVGSSRGARLSVGRALWATFVGAIIIALTEVLLLPREVASGLGAVRTFLVLAPLTIANFLPLVACSVLAFWALSSSRKRFKVLSLSKGTWIAWIISTPYLAYICWFTFSGGRVSDLWFRPLLTGGLFLFLSAGVLSLAELFLHRQNQRSKIGLWAIVATLLQVGLLQINRWVLPNEYIPLHVFVAIAAVVLSSFAAIELSKLSVFPPSGRALNLALGLGIVAAFVFSGVVLKRSNTTSWIIWGESAAARYISQPLFHDDSDSEGDSGLEARKEKPAAKPSKEETLLRQMRRDDRAPHIIVFSVDNLQADRVGAYGYDAQPTTPNIDQVAAGGVLFRNAYSLFPGTRVFMSSMLTGRRLPAFGPHRVPPEYQQTSLTRLLKKRDYHILVKGVFELTRYREFDPSDYQIDTWLRRATPEEIRKTPTIPHIPMKERLELLTKHLQEASEAEKPVFVWMHVLRPHRSRGTFPADKRYPFGKSIDNLYDAAIANADDWLAEIRKAFSSEISDDREVVWVVMSDHGAGMTRGDKRNVGKTLYDDQVRVPLIISGPGIEPGELEAPVDVAVDISATLLDIAGIAPPEDYDGISLLPLLSRREDAASLDDRLIPLRTSDWSGGVLKGFKYIQQGKSVSLFDTHRDPNEHKNVADEESALLREMRKRVKAEHLRQDRAFREGLESQK